jgi:hypothetical protein
MKMVQTRGVRVEAVFRLGAVSQRYFPISRGQNVDPIKNPYTPNAGSRPAALAGRDAQLEQFRVLVGRLKEGTTIRA